MMKKQWKRLALILSMTALVAACGDGDEPSDDEPGGDSGMMDAGPYDAGPLDARADEGGTRDR